jgi:hypothetical protein
VKKTKNAPQVFVDANIIIRAGKPPGGAEWERVGDLVNAGMITVLTTDLTVTEVAKKHADNDYQVIKEIARPHFRKLIDETVGVKIDEINKTELWDILISKYRAAVAAMFGNLDATHLAIDDIKPSAVFNTYAEGTGLFSGESKKDQFPDAFIFECLKQAASKDNQVIIVSDDGDFEKAAEGEQYIQIIKSLPELFKALGYEMEAPQVSQFLQDKSGDLATLVGEEIKAWGLVGDVEDSEIFDVQVLGLEIGKITSFRSVEEGDDILVVGTVRVSANVEYSHPDWDNASYDSEDKVLIPWRDVEGETEIEFDLDISIAISVDDEGTPEKIETVSTRNADFQYVELHPYESYK